MGGAACVAGSLLSVAKLGIPINIKGINYKKNSNEI
jgi:leucyl aminopeptidase